MLCEECSKGFFREVCSEWTNWGVSCEKSIFHQIQTFEVFNHAAKSLNFFIRLSSCRPSSYYLLTNLHKHNSITSHNIFCYFISCQRHLSSWFVDDIQSKVILRGSQMLSVNLICVYLKLCIDKGAIVLEEAIVLTGQSENFVDTFAKY